jgi:hypothetical protein
MMKYYSESSFSQSINSFLGLGMILLHNIRLFNFKEIPNDNILNDYYDYGLKVNTHLSF